MSTLRIDLAPMLRPYADELITRCLLLEQDLLGRTGSVLREQLPSGAWLLVVDETTWHVAGKAVCASLAAAGLEVTRYTVEPGLGEHTPVADDAKVAAVTQALSTGGYGAAIAVGAGTVNDIVKAATTELGLPYAVIATAPSMNGYTSSLAALLSKGVKITQPCQPPVACLVDLDVMAAAPYRMIASGLGDLMSKPVSNADWRLAYRLTGAEYATRVMGLIDAGGALLDGIAEHLPQRDISAIGKLCGSLCISGLAMGLAGSSAPSSGGEHLISHYLDMTHFAWGEPHDFHGCQVGVATLTTAALYERLAAVDPAQIDVEARVASLPDWNTYAIQVKRRFGSLAGAVIDQARRAHPSPQELRERLQLLKRDWDDLLNDVGQTLRPTRDLNAELRRADCPTTFEEIQVTPERARRAVAHSKDIRDRYTILHLGADLGLLDSWVGDLIP
jgi:glycerol-1-phosphate dehydrogenase [NAD(P)+]